LIDIVFKLWAVLAENKLTYYSQKPLVVAGQEPTPPRGFLIINKGGHCDMADAHNVKGVSLSGQGKNCFIVTEPAQVIIIIY